MIVVGLTGGIGSGKTTIGQYFESLGIAVYIADKEAKALMNRSTVVKRKLVDLFGDNAYENGKLNRPFLASKIFANQKLLSKMNAIIHPKVASHFQQWLKKQNSPYVIKEAAIIFENQLQDQYQYIITVVADKDLRIKRIIERDDTSADKIKSIIKNQLSDEEKIEKSDFVIYNNDLNTAKNQALKIHNQILQEIGAKH